MKIGIYGGTFNPIHYGHLRTAEEVFDILLLDKVLFIPSGKTPFDKPDIEKAEYRYEMVRKAVKGNRRFEVTDMEVRRRGRSYTVDTIKRLRNKYRGSELYFILGIDTFLDLPCWKQPDILIDQTNLVVISRPGYAFIDLAASPYLEGISRNTLRELDKGKMNMFSFSISGKRKGYLCNVTGLNISASRIRSLVRSGKEIKYLLPDSVKSYIISHALFKRK
ncbi:MAG: nicotinate (nicotinamide) nucleotide adenylyltransferase [Nitrospirae bacterium]|nr:nicotinate (nicotinamide) nucleotide adenylyltransferase [Nitrospirota bacterium]